MSRFHFFCALMLLAQLSWAAPQFEGIREALPAPGAAVLHWERATGDKRDGSTKYRIYGKSPAGWDLSKPLAEVSTSDWAILGLTPGIEYEFAVRAKDATGEDDNRKSIKVIPTNTIPSEEWRGTWMSRFEWPGGSRADIQKRLTQTMQTLSAANMNALVLQVRGQGDTFYPSADEPFSASLSADARTFDPISYAIAEAKKNRIQLHAWINLSVIWQSKDKQLPKDESHPFYKIADSRYPAKRTGLIHDEKGNPKQWGADGYVWLTHGNPYVNSYLRKQVMDFLEKYPVDGLHWDDRTAMPNGTSRDPVSVQRFGARGNPMKIADFTEWQRDQLRRFLSDIYVQTKAKNPKLLITMSPFGIADKNRIDVKVPTSDGKGFGVEPEKWLAMGVLDALIPQIYWNAEDKEPNYPALARDWAIANKSGRPIWPGSAITASYGGPQPLDSMQLRYVAMARAYKMNGNNYWHYTGAKPAEWISFGAKAYPVPATVPVPRHMRGNPTGQIMGTVKDGNGRPIFDAWVAVSGSKYIYTTSGDGFYGIPNLKPGEYTVTFSTGSGPNIEKKVTVVGGKTATVDLTAP